MQFISDAVAIATLSSRVCDTRNNVTPRAAVVAALKVSGPMDALTFTLHTHVPGSASRLRAWVDGLVADDPLLIGYRLARTSRLLIASGCRRHLAASFNRTGQHEILDVVHGKPMPLSTIALLNGVMAVDEEALVAARPISVQVAANLALINAVASWIIAVRRSTPGRELRELRRDALRQLVAALLKGPAPAPVVAAVTCPVQ